MRIKSKVFLDPEFKEPILKKEIFLWQPKLTVYVSSLNKDYVNFADNILLNIVDKENDIAALVVDDLKDIKGSNNFQQSKGFKISNQIYGPSGVIIDNDWDLSTSITVPEYGLYAFEFNSCDTIATIQVGFSCELQFPNTLTPNGDGNNDLLIISDMNPGIYTNTLLTIINRWGEEVFKSAGYGLNEDWWDGKTTYNNIILEDGVYYYIFDVFNNVHNQKESYSGYLTIFTDE